MKIATPTSSKSLDLQSVGEAEKPTGKDSNVDTGE
jgi:hypothetical protein